ncbi:MAG: NAD-dependent succinate-semialdehyde dehydrogenase [Nitrososphaeraceae archaeon]|nr:NAD-dependent succinate-semialdehyde dehydrogenase [Nitrososphaeraceae archaeon]MDW0170987.1 NAD-dependent succinate-semialdehyde dehydrogenase [Nitrososphaeraceae archaeon]MDW0174004.1 NAD-dependent succinate-semialdehyde dehydrogenase [Nitrososphaeraceae archaeon]MDW0178752.1 NAD-dependent succinate-semialdehyde dehydrogenase [Nitrososphaeraceae archaeon]MDW0179726.1 NAD-dependent succinate-semialdehyde dehydrogenase [Nitrososphaeraceae archaeon]
MKQTDTKLRTINPTTEAILNEYDIMTKEQINTKVKTSRTAFSEWRNDIDKRVDFLYSFANELKKNLENLARTATQEMGKAIKESRSEVEKCAWAIEYFADNGKIFASDEVVNTDARKSIITFEPIGVIGSIMPWNFPYWQALRFAAPSLMVGNTIVLKPASATMQCGIEIERVFNKSGLADGVFQTLIGDSSIAETLIDSDINAVTFTGSVQVGGKVAQRATSQLKKTVLELGGSDPFIVCEDADMEKASSGAVKGRFINSGQSCIASKRFIVVRKIANEFIEMFVQKTKKLKVGDPMSNETDIGPLVNINSLKNMESLVAQSVKEGAELLTGGERTGSKGFFYPPTVLKNVSPNMRIASEEVFGPIAPVIIAEDEKEAMNVANDSKYGLGASIWTQDLDKAERMSRAIESGIVTVNNVVISDPRVPFGGIKNSGFGRELSKYGMLEFVNIKSVRFYDQLIHNHYVE